MAFALNPIRELAPRHPEWKRIIAFGPWVAEAIRAPPWSDPYGRRLAAGGGAIGHLG